MVKTKGYNIRRGGMDDIPALIKLGAKMHKESPKFKGSDYSEEKCAQLGAQLVEQGGIFLAEVDEEPIGMLLGMVVPHFFGNDLISTDLVVFVEPAHRGGTLVVRLIKKYETWAISMGAKHINFGISTEIEAERTAKLYERLGYKISGYIAVKEV